MTTSSPQSPAGRPEGRSPGAALGDPAVPPAEINGSSSDRGDGVLAPQRTAAAEAGSGNRAQQVRAQAAAKATQLRGQAMEKAPQVRAHAVETAQQIRVRAAAQAPQMAQANRGKAAAALACGLLVLWFRSRRNRRSSRAGDGVAGAVEARGLVGDTLDALSTEAGSTGRARKKARKARGRATARAQAVERAQQARAQAVETAQQARAQAAERAQQLREQATEKTQAAERAQQAAQEAQELVQALKQRLPRRDRARRS